MPADVDPRWLYLYGTNSADAVLRLSDGVGYLNEPLSTEAKEKVSTINGFF